ncbi:LacI family DNA-binding transcriptional regulator [Microbacterium trichothecenolyticum]|uniref:LacI family DNA-binding transcriptional regulator n=1 Tax=Microbacterium trichothecenolyticum TaxID=69370 RepID=UPI001C6E736C|nr:LacI family DNA-binding transcriptional regulator [Microbacterium trichothecenolyticum]MBW9122075.1 LacI family DNA-binding transcriptional regulator [Microbacterium trichothecenolyticum]
MDSDRTTGHTKRATVSDVAAAAGVSASTVSYALNGKSSVREETRRRILQAAARLGYRPNGVARAMRVGCRSVVALVLPDLSSCPATACEACDAFLGRLTRGAVLAAGVHECELLILNWHVSRSARSLPVDAVVVVEVDTQRTIRDSIEVQSIAPPTVVMRTLGPHDRNSKPGQFADQLRESLALVIGAVSL